MIYRLIRHLNTSELDCASDLIARQYAQADWNVERVETEAGRVVYRRVKEEFQPTVDLSSFNQKEA